MEKKLQGNDKDNTNNIVDNFSKLEASFKDLEKSHETLYQKFKLHCRVHQQGDAIRGHNSLSFVA